MGSPVGLHHMTPSSPFSNANLTFTGLGIPYGACISNTVTVVGLLRKCNGLLCMLALGHQRSIPLTVYYVLL